LSPAGAGPPQQPAAAASTVTMSPVAVIAPTGPGPEHTPVSGSTSSTRAAASLSPAMSATIERTCS
jgi:hypothetical protein